MKLKTKMGLTTIVSMMFLLLFPVVYAGTETSGGWTEGVDVRAKYEIEQDEFASAEELYFTSYNRKADINGWKITITVFDDAWSGRFSDRDVDVEAWNPPFPVVLGQKVEVEVTQWLDTEGYICPNSMGLGHVYWRDTQPPEAKAMPDHHWWVKEPEVDPELPGHYWHKVTITNHDSESTLKVSGLTFKPTMTWYEDLSEIVFTGPVYDTFTLDTGSSWSTEIFTVQDFYGGYIYFKYAIFNLDGTKVVCNAWGGHPVNRAVGGILVPVDKFGLLVPYIGLASTIIVATAATAIYTKRVKRRKQK